MAGPLRIAIVVGQAAPPGRLAATAGALAEELRRLRADAAVDVVDLSAAPLELCDGRSLDAYGGATRDFVATITEATAVVLCSPVYRASFPGVLKNALDLLPVEALRAKPVGIVALGASDHHYLGVDSHLRAVLAWFGAIALPTSVYLTGGDFSQPDRSPSAGARAELAALGEALVRFAELLGGEPLGPSPLAARRKG
jgi:FMN reductase